MGLCCDRRKDGGHGGEAHPALQGGLSGHAARHLAGEFEFPPR